MLQSSLGSGPVCDPDIRNPFLDHDNPFIGPAPTPGDMVIKVDASNSDISHLFNMGQKPMPIRMGATETIYSSSSATKIVNISVPTPVIPRAMAGPSSTAAPVTVIKREIETYSPAPDTKKRRVRTKKTDLLKAEIIAKATAQLAKQEVRETTGDATAQLVKQEMRETTGDELEMGISGKKKGKGKGEADLVLQENRGARYV